MCVVELEENSMHGSKRLKRVEKIGSTCSEARGLRLVEWTVEIGGYILRIPRFKDSNTTSLPVLLLVIWH